MIFLTSLFESPAMAKRIIVIPMLPHVSQQIFHSEHLNPPRHKDVVRDLKEIIQKAAKGDDKSAVVISHSKYVARLLCRSI